MEFKQVKTTAPHKVYLVDGDVVLHDCRGTSMYDQSITDAALEAFGLPGSIGAQLEDDGFMLQTTRLHHYHVKSVSVFFHVSGKYDMGPDTTRRIVGFFLLQEALKDKSVFLMEEVKNVINDKKLSKQSTDKTLHDAILNSELHGCYAEELGLNQEKPTALQLKIAVEWLKTVVKAFKNKLWNSFADTNRFKSLGYVQSYSCDGTPGAFTCVEKLELNISY